MELLASVDHAGHVAHTFLTVLAAVARGLDNGATDLIALTTNESRRLFNAVVQTATHGPEHVLTCLPGDAASKSEPARPTTNDAKPQATATSTAVVLVQPPIR